MVLVTSFEMAKNAAKITLKGRLDATTTPIFKEEVDKAVSCKAKRLILLLKDLEYISSSGLRILIFFKQKAGADVDIYVISPQPLIKEVLEMTGFHYGVHVLDEYNPEIENI